MNVHSKGSYSEKLVSADEAVKCVKSGDSIFFGEFAMAPPPSLDTALAKRVDELNGVVFWGTSFTALPEVVKADLTGDHFIMHDYHFGGVARRLHDRDLCYYVPIAYHQVPRLIHKYVEMDVALIQVGPMNDKGFFNLGPSNSSTLAVCSKATKIIVEVNTKVPTCWGGNSEFIHIDSVDMIVEGDNLDLVQIKPAQPTDIDRMIAKLVMEEIRDGSCLQLGIGGLPNVIGAMIAASDLKDLGVHTEMLADSYMDMYQAGRITGNRKGIDKEKMVYTFALGSQRLYDFLDNNPLCASYPVNYTNDPRMIAMNDNVIAINNALQVDLYSQVASESFGNRQISGTGGQLDFMLGAFQSHGGKGFICISSTYKDNAGEIQSRIVPTLSPATIVTLPRSLTQFIVTEYGIAQMKGKSTWQRAEALINIAHPMFRDELIKQAQALKIWRHSSKQDA